MACANIISYARSLFLQYFDYGSSMPQLLYVLYHGDPVLVGGGIQNIQLSESQITDLPHISVKLYHITLYILHVSSGVIE